MCLPGFSEPHPLDSRRNPGRSADIELIQTTDLLRVLADPNRVRLLALLVDEELTVAELSAITRLKQPRVSTHLSKLKEPGLVVDRRAGVAAFYRCPIDELPAATRALWASLSVSLDDAVLNEDQQRRAQVLRARSTAANWPDAVAGDMERHYSPGRTWEALMRASVQLLDLGDVLDVASGDGALAELLAPRARSLTCVDLSERVVEAGARRLLPWGHARMLQGDMHALPLADASVDLVLLLQALPYSEAPAGAFAEAARVLRRGGRLLLTALDAHEHRASVAPFGHRNLGFGADELRRFAQGAGLSDIEINHGGVETRPPHFVVWVLNARR